nr:immunoglobulin heavy chain junction region [Macaca mulatta]
CARARGVYLRYFDLW